MFLFMFSSYIFIFLKFTSSVSLTPLLSTRVEKEYMCWIPPAQFIVTLDASTRLQSLNVQFFVQKIGEKNTALMYAALFLSLRSYLPFIKANFPVGVNNHLYSVSYSDNSPISYVLFFTQRQEN